MSILSHHFFLLFSLSFALIGVIQADISCEPTQIHIALGSAFYSSMIGSEADSNNASIIMGFVTTDFCPNATVTLREYQTKNNNSSPSSQKEVKMSNSTVVSLNLNENNKSGLYTRYSYDFLFDDLNSSSLYSYSIVWEATTETEEYFFKVPRTTPFESSRMLLIADFDHKSVAQPTDDYLDTIANSTNLGSIDFVFHAGDFAYDLDSDDGKNGDWFFDQVQAFAKGVPYMIVPGNHEDGVTNTLLRYRNYMPLKGKYDDSWYSFNVGLVHFVVFNLDSIYFGKYDAMLDWMEKDLATAREPENMLLRPWVVMMTHRPLYCSHIFDKDCWVNYFQYEAIDDLAYEYQVDLYLSGHVHTYERGKSAYRGDVAKCSSSENGSDYVDCEAPPNIVAGAPGNQYFLEMSDYHGLFQTTLKQIPNLSFGILEAVNQTHLLYKQVNSTTLKPTDSFYVVKTRYETFPLWIVYTGVGLTIFACFLIFLGGCLYMRHYENKNQKNVLKNNSPYGVLQREEES